MIDFKFFIGIIYFIIFVIIFMASYRQRNPIENDALNRNSEAESKIWMVFSCLFIVAVLILLLAIYFFSDFSLSNFFLPELYFYILAGIVLFSAVIIFALFPYLLLLYIIENKRENILPKIRKGLKLIKSQSATERAEGLLLLANFLQQQMFVDEINNNVRHLNLQNIDLTNAQLSKIDLTGVNLSKSDLSQASLHFTKLSQANLSGAKFNNASLIETNLIQARNIGQASFDDVVMIDVKMDENGFNQLDMVLSEQQKSKIKVRILDIIELGKTIVVTIPEN